MAAETYAYNLIPGCRALEAPNPENLGSGYFDWLVKPSMNGHAPWATFRDWRNYEGKGKRTSDAARTLLSSDGKSGLLVGNAVRLAREINRAKEDGSLRNDLQNLDLLAGGPPCQSFSAAGKRERDNPRNLLFRAFVDVAQALRPKVVLFENVVGITKAFIDGSGGEWHAWYEVCHRFKSAGYLPIPAVVDAADFGVPQTRNRFIMVALRDDLGAGIFKAFSATPKWSALLRALERARDNYEEATPPTRGVSSLVLRTDRLNLDWPEQLLPKPTFHHRTVREAIDDIRDLTNGRCPAAGDYARFLHAELPAPDGVAPIEDIDNHDLRQHGPVTRARFQILQILASSGIRPKNLGAIMDDRRSMKILKQHALLFPYENCTGSKRRPKSIEELNFLLLCLGTSKHSQRCLDGAIPAPAQLSIPDDYIHYDESLPRVLTIREMARIQSFPDWFVFRSKQTTGGASRAFEVPQYTQVGNAVPPLLAKHLGSAIASFLDDLRQAKIIDPSAKPMSHR